MAFRFADAPAIIRANQKDELVKLTVSNNAKELLQWFKGVKFIHAWSSEIDATCSAIYLALTTLAGSRTLGEEYTDLFYLTDKRQVPSRHRIAAYVSASTLGPLLVHRWLLRLRKRMEAKTTHTKWAPVVEALTPNTLISINLAIFYISGAYYQLSKRLMGLRYALGHPQQENSGSYELLGLLMVVRGIGKMVNSLRNPIDDDSDPLEYDDDGTSLGDPKMLPWIPESARSCNLCLDLMQSPTLTLCGHLYCWSCISDWCRERPECPLCRQTCHEQHLLLISPSQ